MNTPRYSFVVPVYRAAAHLETWKRELLVVFENLTDLWEVILVDDGSQDDSWKIISGWAQKDPRFRAVGLSRNFGQHCAMTAGFGLARGEFIMSLDDDLQIPHSVIPKFIERINQGADADIVVGRRTARKDPLFSRQLPSFLLNIFLRLLTGLKRTDFGCNHVMYKKWVIDVILACRNRRRFTPEIVNWVGGTVTEIEVPHCEGPSRYRFTQLLRLNLDLLLHYSLWPLHILVLLFGLLLMSVGLGLFLWNVWVGRIMDSVIHLSREMGLGVLLVFSGLIAYSLEYILSEQMLRPLYVFHPQRGENRFESDDSATAMDLRNQM